MTIAEFKQQVVSALAAYFPRSTFRITERRGVEFQCRVEIDEITLIDIYQRDDKKAKFCACSQRQTNTRLRQLSVLASASFGKS